MEQVNERAEMLSWAAFIGFMFIGMGVGAYYDHGGIGIMIGMGVGYLAEGVIGLVVKK